jgi:hypothetical protein
MNAPFIDFIRRFRELERANAERSASTAPRTGAARQRPADDSGLPTIPTIETQQSHHHQVSR